MYIYRNIIALVIMLFTVSMQAVNVIPYPFEYSTNSTENYLFSDTTAIVCRQKSLIPVVEIFANTVRQSTGLALPIEKHSIRPIYVEVDKFIKHPEYYYLIVTKTSVEIYGGSPSAIYYGLQTLLQFLPPQIESPTLVKGIEWTVPAMVIEDFPKYNYRGLHLDLCRHFMPISFIKKQIDWMSKFKLNRLHLHLTDDQAWTIEIKKYPKLTEVGSKRREADGSIYYGGYYTQNELRDLVYYASLRGITIVPEIEMPGHAMAALAAYPELGCRGRDYSVRSVWGIEQHLFCAGNESVYKFIEDVLTEVSEIFPSEYIHLGGDECPTSVWHKCPKCQGMMKRKKLRTEARLYGYFMKRVEAILSRLDRKMIAWDEIIAGGVSPSATAMCWHDEKMAIKAVDKGYQVVMTPWNICYFDHYQGSKLFEPMAQGGYTPINEIYNWSPMPDRVSNDHRKRILGAQANVWTEYIYTPEQAEYMIYPRLLAMAETMWTHCEAKDSASFYERLDSMCRRLDYGGIHYHIPMPEGPEAQYIEFFDSLNVPLHNNLKYPMYYALDSVYKFNIYDSVLTLRNSCVLRAFSVSPTGHHSDTITIEYKKVNSIHYSYKQEGYNGLYRQRAYGYFPNARGIDTVRFDTNELVDSLISNPVDVYTRPWIEVYNGYFNVDSTDCYMLTSDVEELWVDGICIVDNNDKVKRCNRYRAVMFLENGKHSFKLIYNNCVNMGFPAIWRKPSIKIRSLKDKKFHDVLRKDFYR